MKRILRFMGGLLGVLVMAGLAVALILTFRGLRGMLQDEATMFQSPIETPTPVVPQITPSPAPTATPVPTPTPLPPIAWSPTPSCKNRPQPLSFWLEYVNKSQDDPYTAARLSSYWRQIRTMSLSLRDYDASDLPPLLEESDNAEPATVLRRELAVIWLNVISGRLNQATSIHYLQYPQLNTIADVLEGFETSISKNHISPHLLDVSKRLQTGAGIEKPVCARLMMLHFGNVITEITWGDGSTTEKKLVGRTQDSTFPWLMSRLIPAPNQQLIAIETVGYESGGPIYLWNRKTGEWLNLNETVTPITAIQGVTMEEEGRDWFIIGWLPDSSHVLIGSTFDQNRIYQIDVKRKAYSTIDIPEKHAVIERKTVDMSSDGTKIVYVNRDTTTHREELYLFNLITEKTTAIISIDDRSGNIIYPQFSPSDDYLLYIFQEAYPSTKQVIIAVNLASSHKTTLFNGELTDSKPVWAPDGQTVAFVRKSKKGYISIPSMGRTSLGSLWTVSVHRTQLNQETFFPGLVLRPSWSPNGQYIAFITHDGGIGMHALGDQKSLWKIASYPPQWPLFTSIYLEP